MGKLSIAVDGRAVLGLTAIGSMSRCDIAWHPSEISGFIEGDWVPSFRRLCLEAPAHQAAQEESRTKLRREDPELLKTLKESFGISDSDSAVLPGSSQRRDKSEHHSAAPSLATPEPSVGSAWYRVGRRLRKSLFG